MLTSQEAAALHAVDPADATACLTELLAIPSVDGTDGEAEIQHHLARRLDRLGLEVDLWPLDLPALRGHPDYPGEEVHRTEAYGLVGSSGPGSPALVLQSHVDVVPPGDRAAWSSDPFTPQVSGTTVIGRGACDMKGGLAAVLAAVAALRRAQVRPAAPFAVHCVVGEEDGGLGAFATLRRGHRGEACIIPEPTSLGLVTGNAGSLTFRVEVPGLATHGSTAYAGSSALDSYLQIHRSLADLQAERNRTPEELMGGYPVAYPLSVGRLRTGDWPSSVPDRLVAEGRYGLRIDEDPTGARAELEAVVADAATRDPFLRDHPPRVTWTGGQFRGGRLPAGHALGQLVRAAHGCVTSTDVGPERGAPYGSDLRLYAAEGIPTLHYGPGDMRLAHGPQESVPIREVVTCARVLILALLRASTLADPKLN